MAVLISRDIKDLLRSVRHINVCFNSLSFFVVEVTPQFGGRRDATVK